MFQTISVILDYLEESDKIAYKKKCVDYMDFQRRW